LIKDGFPYCERSSELYLCGTILCAVARVGVVIEDLGTTFWILAIMYLLREYLIPTLHSFSGIEIDGIVRLGGAICGIIVAADNFGNVNVIIAEIVLTQVGSFMIYYSLVAFYHSSYYPLLRIAVVD